MRKFSVRPTLTLKGRTFKGLRGWSGKPVHPPLTDFPIAAYVFAAGFDMHFGVGGKHHTWARELWHAGTFTFIGGAVVSVFAALTGLWDAWKSSEAGTQARRTINTHATIMVTVTVLALADIAWRLNDYHTHLVTPVGIAVLSVVIACWCRSAPRSAGASSSSTDSTSRQPAIPRSGTRPNKTCSPASTTDLPPRVSTWPTVSEG